MDLTLVAMVEHFLDETGDVLEVRRTGLEQSSVGLSLHSQDGGRDARVTRSRRGLEDVGGEGDICRRRRLVLVGCMG